MKPPTRPTRWLPALLTAALLVPAPLLAYGGPGSVVTGIGALVAAVAAIAAAIFGFFWFPVKRLIQKLRDGETGDEGSESGELGGSLAEE